VSSVIARPGAAFGVYPERERADNNWLQQSADRAMMFVGHRLFPIQRGFDRAIVDINRQGDLLTDVKSSELRAQAQRLRQQFASHGQTDALVAACFALVREVVKRELDLRLFDEQLLAGWAMFKGHLAEMASGEGKTLANLLPACAAALAGVPVHLVCVSDQLAQRDANLLKQVYQALDISAGLIQTDTPIGQRRAAYQCDVTYCSSKQLAFDYLQDRLLLRRQSGILRLQVDRLNKENPLANQLRLRGLCYAIIDDADTTLIDESLSPLILSRSGRATRQPDKAEGDVLARTTFPRFFQRYVKLCGSATSLRALATEIHSTYGLSVQSIPTRQPSRQRLAPDQVFLDQASKWQAICERVREQHKTGQPVLVATHNSADTELLGRLLTTAGVPHQVSEADNWDKGTQQRSRAGVAGAVTISTAQSSHGLDIQLDSQAKELGGLYVILTERCRAARLDVRLLGHCARRGEPGTGVAMLSLEDQLAEAQLPFWLRSLLQRNRLAGAAQALRLAQQKQQRIDAQARKRLLSADRQRDELLAFSGRAI
jgi:preprotein translocase subunit SecA